MLKNILAALSLSLLAARATAQIHVSISPTLGSELPKDTLFIKSLDSRLAQKEYESITPLTIQVINFYPVEKEQYWVSLACTDSAQLYRLLTLIATHEADRYTFTSPLAYLTRHWQTTQVGLITYHYPDNINLARARAFEKNNELVAKKLGLTPEKFDFYLTNNYQEIPPLLGYPYDPFTVGRTRDGSFGDGHDIFAIQHNEDFSHDLIHYYVSKIRTSPRNSAAEEGLAYYWGNAYYTDSNRNMIDYPTQLAALKTYLHEHPDTWLVWLFDHNTKPFPNLAPELSARSILSARLFQLIEDTRGIDGVKTLINCGKGDDNYFTALYALTGINRTNFDLRLRALLEK